VASENDAQRSDPVCIVGLGASAGGLEPMIQFFDAMPDDSGIAFVVVQHAAPNSPSQLPDILSRHTTMRVEIAEEGTVPEPDVVYIVRGHTHVSVDGEALSISTTERGGASDVIDFFFTSLAEAREERSIGVLLSGTGSDGAQGLREIRAAGGMTIAQDPEEAAYDGMPLAAIRAGSVDRMLPVAEMPGVIIGYVEHAVAAASEHVDEGSDETGPAVEPIISLLHQQRETDFRFYKRSTLTRRIRRRMGISLISDMREYQRILQSDPDEVKQLARDMLIGVTSFFRDLEAFEDLRERAIMPIIQSKGPDESVRAWVPGASTGEEAYSIAILIHDVMSELKRDLPVKIFASDLNPDAMQFARGGRYPESIATQVPEDYLERFFQKRDQAYRVTEQMRESVIFTTHNVLSDPPFSQLDLISCRNVLIYMKPEAQEIAHGVFAFALRSGGRLFLGSSDATPGHEDLFARVDRGSNILRRTEKPQALPDLPRQARVREVAPPQKRSHGVISNELARISRDVLLSHFAAAVVLTNETGEALHFFGPTSKYLEHPTGQATLNIFDMTAEPVGSRLKEAMRKALHEDRRQQIDGVKLGEAEPGLSTQISVVPVERRAEEDRIVAFVFEDVLERGAATPSTEAVAGPAEQRRVRELQDELDATRLDLQATIRESEFANEDLIAANEEIISMNEELQSTNEELQTSTEELQSVNEELNTANQELSQKVDQVSQAKADLENLLSAADIKAVFLARDLTIRRFSPAATRLLNLITTDIGRPISHVSHSLTGLDLPPKVQHVLDTGERIEEEMQDADGNWYIMRIHPYASDTQVEGAVVNFSNVTRVKHAEALAQSRTEKLRELARQITEAEQAERHRIAGLIHDEIQQMLAGTMMKVKSVASLADDGPTKDTAIEAVELLEEAVRTARTLTSHLSPPVLRDAGFIAALNWLAAEIRRMHGIGVDVQVENRTEPGSQALALFLVEAARELLFNVAKHSGADRASLRLSRSTDRVSIEVLDRGCGFDADRLNAHPYELGFGLIGITRRAEILGGGLQIESVLGEGCRATLWLPPEIFDRTNPAHSGLTTYHRQARQVSSIGFSLVSD
jgi:two-component system CheB/CheR fusion protein